MSKVGQMFAALDAKVDAIGNALQGVSANNLENTKLIAEMRSQGQLQIAAAPSAKDEQKALATKRNLLEKKLEIARQMLASTTTACARDPSDDNMRNHGAAERYLAKLQDQMDDPGSTQNEM